MSARRILITGAAGFIGSYVTTILSSLGHDIVGSGRRRVPSLPARIRWVPCDLLDAGAGRALAQSAAADTLIHLAWFTEHGKFWDAAVNVDWVSATLTLLDEFRRSGGRRAVLLGSCTEYDWRYGFCTEGLTPTDARTLYGRCKDKARQEAERYCEEHGLEFTWARVFFPYGPGEATERLLPAVLTALLRGTPVRCSVGEQYRDFIHVEDVARALATLAVDVGVRGPVNVSSGVPTRIRDIVLKCVDAVRPGAKPEFGAVAVPADDPPFVVGNNQRLLSSGWRPCISIDEGIEAYVRALTSHGSQTARR